jgi:hypothetical protein
MRFSVILAALIIGGPLAAGTAFGQQRSLDSLLIAHSYEISVDSGRVTGPGLDVILKAAHDAQFFGLAEEHNLRELNELTPLLFDALHRSHGFSYIALEQGSVITSWLGSPEHRGNLGSITGLIGRYPHAPTFATDEELEMMATIGGISSATGNPIWGVDQELGAFHILDRLAELAPNDSARDQVEKLAKVAHKYESTRSGGTHYLAAIANPDDFRDLSMLFEAGPGSEALVLIEALQRTSRIYHNFSLSRQGQPTGYENGREREESMKLRFMEQYRSAQAAGDTLPRVVAKLGHWHLYRGIYRANVPTFGNFLSEFALSNDMSSFMLATFVVESPEDWRNTKGPLANISSQSPFTVVDFRPLRPLAHQNVITGLSDAFRRLLFQADGALVIRGGRTGGYNIVRSGSNE